MRELWATCSGWPPVVTLTITEKAKRAGKVVIGHLVGVRMTLTEVAINGNCTVGIVFTDEPDKVVFATQNTLAPLICHSRVGPAGIKLDKPFTVVYSEGCISVHITVSRPNGETHKLKVV